MQCVECGYFFHADDLDFYDVCGVCSQKAYNPSFQREQPEPEWISNEPPRGFLGFLDRLLGNR